MISLRSKLIIPTLLTALLFVVGIGYVAILQSNIFRQQTENTLQQHKYQLHVFIDGMQEQTRHFMELLSNKWHFIDSVTARNMDALLDEITPFNKGTLGSFITVYDMEGNIIARADAPGIFGKPDELHPQIVKMKTGPVTRSIITLYQDNLLVLELKRLETNYGTVGVLAVGHYVHEEKVDEFARLRQICLILNYNSTPVVFSKNFRLSEEMLKSTIQVKFEENFGKESPLVAFLHSDTSKIEAAYWRNLFIVIFVLIALSSTVIFFSRRIIMNTVNALNKARVSSEKELVQRKQAEEALKKFNVELESLVRERTKELEDEIFKHKRAEERLHIKDFAFKSSLSADSIGSNEGFLTHANPTFARIWGYEDVDEVIGKPILGFLADKDKALEIIESINTTGKWEGEYTALRKDGSTFIAWSSANAVYDMEGNQTALYSSVVDVTERKQAEEELKKYRAHLEELVEDRTNELKEKTDKIEESRKALTYLVEDVNEAGKELEKANKRLKELDRLKSMFIASMSHELRTPLNSIIGFTGIILQGLTGEINAEQKDQLQRVNGSAKHLLNLITDIIDISKIEAGKVEVYAEEVNLNTVIKEAVSSLKPEMDNKGIGLEISLLPDLQLTTDRKRLLQCILNYLGNALKFTEKGKIKITALEVDGMMEIRVKDTGIGIKEEDMPRLFKSFVRLDTPLKTIIPGTGLGLYLTKKLATEVLKGSVSVESKYGEGSMFVLKITREI